MVRSLFPPLSSVISPDLFLGHFPTGRANIFAALCLSEWHISYYSRGRGKRPNYDFFFLGTPLTLRPGFVLVAVLSSRLTLVNLRSSKPLLCTPLSCTSNLRSLRIRFSLCSCSRAS